MMNKFLPLPVTDQWIQFRGIAQYLKKNLEKSVKKL